MTEKQDQGKGNEGQNYFFLIKVHKVLSPKRRSTVIGILSFILLFKIVPSNISKFFKCSKLQLQKKLIEFNIKSIAWLWLGGARYTNFGFISS